MDPASPLRRDQRGGLARVLLVAVVVIGVAGFAGYWFLLRSDPKPKPKIETTPVVEGGTLDGTWTLTANDDRGSFVGYRIKESFASGLVDQTATGRTTDVTGSLTVTGTEVTDVKVDANLGALHSERDFRDHALQDRGLETTKFPTASFTATKATLPSTPAKGETVKVTVAGELTLHGVTKPVSVPLDGRWDGSTIQAVGEVPITLTDYGIVAPTGGQIASIEPTGSLELQLFFTKQG